MLIEQKKKTIVDKMNNLKGKDKSEFGQYLAKEFTDEELRDLNHENADKLLNYLAKT
jgi:hypothetical protein